MAKECSAKPAGGHFERYEPPSGPGVGAWMAMATAAIPQPSFELACLGQVDVHANARLTQRYNFQRRAYRGPSCEFPLEGVK